MSTCPFPCLESSPTPSHLPKPCMRKISFSKQNLLFLKINYRSVGKNMGLPSEVNWLVSFSKQSWSSSEMICWPISQPNSLENHPVKYLSQPCSFFRKFMSCTHTQILGYPMHMKCIMSFQSFLYNISNISICNILKFALTTHVIQ